MALKANCVVLLLAILIQIAVTSVIPNAILQSNLDFSNESLTTPDIRDAKCLETGICHEVFNYPNELANRLLKVLSKGNITRYTYERDFVNNDGSTPLCSEEKVFYPLAAKDNNGTWHYILNPESGRPFQAYQVETCKKIGRCESPQIADSNFVIDCKQNVVYKSMVYLDIDLKRASVKHFAVPNCCSCSLSHK